MTKISASTSTRILVTGGAGYIGAIATNLLLDAGYEVVVLDDLSTGHKESVDARAKFVHGSILNKEEVKKALAGCEGVLHFAGKSLVGESVLKPDLYVETNIEGSRNLLNVMCELGVKKIIFSSSASTYGEPSSIPISENSETKPTNPYGLSKLAVDQLLAERSILDGFAACSLRYFNVVGSLKTPNGWLNESHDPETHLIPNVLKASQAKPLKIFGSDWPTADGTCIRDYVHVVDLVEAHILALKNLTTPGHVVINLGSGRGYSVKEVIDSASKISGTEICVEMDERRAGDPAVLVASISKAKEVLGWTPSRNLDSMIRDSYEALL